MSVWEIPSSIIKKDRFDFRANDMFHKKDGTTAIQIIEADVIRIKYEKFAIRDGKYISKGEVDTSAELFTQMLKGS